MASNYVNNKTLHEELVKWKAERANDPTAPLPATVGEAVLQIADRFSKKPNFFGYSYREDMVGAAVLAVCKYVHNYNPAKTTNAFAYVTQIVRNAFIRHIQEQKEAMYRTQYICERAVCSHENYRGFQREVNRHDEYYQKWLVDKEAEKAAKSEANKSKRRKKALVAA